jgi:hypothetical protein
VLAGTVLRFWGLGSVGLHGDDEDTTALPAVHLVEHGTPEFPSGLYYVRALAQTYMIAGAILAFGESEWSIRLPSAVCGVVLIFLAYLLGRQFLTPLWNAAFVASIAFLPELILLSQNARMYIFLVTCVVALSLLVLKWESSSNDLYVVLALVVMLIGIHFQTLMSLAAPLFLYPGILNGDRKRLAYGAIAVVLSLAGLELVHRWTMSFYPPPEFPPMEASTDTGEVIEPPGPLDAPMLLLIGFGLLFAIAAWRVMRRVEGTMQKLAVGVALMLGVAAQFAFQYHIALWIFGAATILALKSQPGTLGPLVVFGIFSVLLAGVHVGWLFWIDIGTHGIVFAKLMGAVSPWSFFNLSALSLAALVLAAVGFVAAAVAFTRGERIPAAWLYVFLLAIPALLAIGYTRSYPASRYLLTTLPAILLAAFYTGQWFTQRFADRVPVRYKRTIEAIAVVAILIAVINPVAFGLAVNAGYDIYPDHDGAAAYVRAQHPGPHDIIVAEDVIVQTYYLDSVDYWLIRESEGLRFARPRHGMWREIYSDTPLLGSGEQLQALIDDPSRGDLYIIGSGELQEDGRLYMRGEAIQEILQSQKSTIVYRGRDNGLTKVWRIPPRGGERSHRDGIVRALPSAGSFKCVG